MVCSFPALRCYWASFILLQPEEGQEHDTDFRAVEAIASEAVKGLVQPPPCSCTMGWDVVWVSCCWSWSFLCAFWGKQHTSLLLYAQLYVWQSPWVLYQKLFLGENSSASDTQLYLSRVYTWQKTEDTKIQAFFCHCIHLRNGKG